MCRGTVAISYRVTSRTVFPVLEEGRGCTNRYYYEYNSKRRFVSHPQNAPGTGLAIATCTVAMLEGGL